MSITQQWHYIAALADGREVIGKALDNNQPLLVPQLRERFSVQHIHKAQPDQTFVASLLYYLGALTITHTTTADMTMIVRPDMRYYGQLLDVLL